MAIEKEHLDQLLAGRDPSEVFGKDGLLDDLMKALSERILAGMGRGKDTVRRHLWRAVLQLMKPAHRTEFLTVPHHKPLKSTNMLERLNEEIRR
ncbi:hypothetical protein GHK29_12800, partial [Sinorhizobium medicae]